MIKEIRLFPILKWAGGKEQELKYIHPVLPKSFNRYFEPFIGGGAVFFSINSDKMFVNDKSQELIDLYQAIREQDETFIKAVQDISYNWKLIENIVHNNKEEFIKIYKSFSENSISNQNLKNWIISFVLSHSIEFNGMFDCNFNVNIENFIREINKNLFSKINRMKKIEQRPANYIEAIYNDIDTILIVPNRKAYLLAAFRKAGLQANNSVTVKYRDHVYEIEKEYKKYIEGKEDKENLFNLLDASKDNDSKTSKDSSTSMFYKYSNILTFLKKFLY